MLNLWNPDYYTPWRSFSGCFLRERVYLAHNSEVSAHCQLAPRQEWQNRPHRGETWYTQGSEGVFLLYLDLAQTPGVRVGPNRSLTRSGVVTTAWTSASDIPDPAMPEHARGFGGHLNTVTTPHLCPQTRVYSITQKAFSPPLRAAKSYHLQHEKAQSAESQGKLLAASFCTDAKSNTSNPPWQQTDIPISKVQGRGDKATGPKQDQRAAGQTRKPTAPRPASPAMCGTL